VKRAAAAALLLAAFALPAAAQDIGFNTWGFRAGASDDPDQVVAGLQADFGELIPNLRFQPNLELGLGDDTTIFSLTAPVHYRFPVEGSLILYGGGGLTLGFIDRDEVRGREDDEDSDFEISPMAVGGVAWPVGQSELSLELNLIGGDFPNLKLMAGWMF
jgi:hypothetical protein